MDGIELQDREFVAAIREGREPNASVHQVLACYEVLDRLDHQIADLVSFVASRTAKVACPAAQGERYEPAVGFVVTGVMAAGSPPSPNFRAALRARRARARRRLSQDDRARS